MRFFKSKPKVPEKTGFMGDTTPEMDQVLAQFKEWILAAGIADLTQLHFDDHDLLRFARARKFELQKMQEMFVKFMEWRKAENIDTIIDTYDYTERAAIQEHYPHGYHGIDKLGRPVYIERFGVLNVTELFKLTTQERIVRHYVQEYEIMMKLRFPACSAVKGEKVIQGLTIFDMTHGSVTMANSQTYGLCKLAAQVGSDYYPEIMGNLFVCNAPMTFTAIWAVVKGFLDEKTRGKIKILGSNFIPTLETYWDRANIPSFMGGDCECEGGCINSNIGPWNDYEIHGTGIRPKGQAEESKTEEVKEEESKAGEDEEVKQHEEGDQNKPESAQAAAVSSEGAEAAAQ